MTSEHQKLVKGANDLQLVVAGMLAFEKGDATNFRHFLTELYGEDFRHLANLDIGGKINYLHKRYQRYLLDRTREKRGGSS
jgi:hypothetical protein